MKHVLVIDDDESVRDAFEIALSSMEVAVEVTSVNNGESGVEKAVAMTPDLIFLDLKMPGIDGVETLRRIRAAGCESPVYIATAFMPEFLDELALAAKEGLRFGLSQKPLTGEQIRMIAEGSIEGLDREGVGNDG